MKTKDIITGNDHVTAKEAVLTQQLNEAMRLIRQLQRNNAELLSQNTNLMKTNSRLIGGNSNSLLQNSNCLDHFDENLFINDILSIINDRSITKIDNKSFITDNSSSDKDNSSCDNDNNPGKKDNNPDNKEDRPRENDNKPEQIEINGKIYNKKELLEKLRFNRNILWKQNLSDDQLIAAFKNRYDETIKAREKIDLEKMKKVPALYYLDHDPKDSCGYEESFNVLLRAYRKFKYRNKKNTPSLVKQLKMLLFLYKGHYNSPRQVFNACNLTNITGYRYAARLSKYGLITCFGRGNAGNYNITQKGIEFLENTSTQIYYWKSKPAQE